MTPAEEYLLDNRYRLMRRLGEGGMATVWLARDTRLDRLVAIKRLYPRYARLPAFLERFEQEARAVARLDDPHIVRVYDVAIGGSRGAYIVMEYVPGTDLKRHLARVAPLPTGRALRLLREVAQGVAVAHQAGLIHRDLKPANVLLRHDGVVKISDFGLACGVGGTGLSEPGMVWGTAHYLAPEQIRGDALTHATDVYALGVILFELLAGRPPFPADDPHTAALAHLQEPVPNIHELAPRVPESVAHLLRRMLAQDPAERPADAVHLTALLDRQIGTDLELTTVYVVPGSLNDAVPPLSVPRTRSRLALASLGFFLLGIATVLLVAQGAVSSLSASFPVLTAGTSEKVSTLVGHSASAGPPTAGNASLQPAPTPTPVLMMRSGNGADFQVQRAGTEMTVDGRLSEWTGRGVQALVPTFGAERWTGRRDLSGEAWAAWDEEFLYLALYVTDDILVQTQRKAEIYRGDSVEFWLDADLAGDFGVTEGDEDDWHLGFSPGNFEDVRPEGVVYLPRRLESPPRGLSVRALPAPDGYTLEARIAWELVEVSPKPGAIFGFDIDLTDNDLSGTAEEQTRVSTSPNMRWNRPTTFGNLILLP